VSFDVLAEASMKMSVFGMWLRVLRWKVTDVSEVLAFCIIRQISPDYTAQQLSQPP
jgi:hypothetical protein